MNRPTAFLTAITVTALSYLYLQFIWVVVDEFLPSVTTVGEIVIGAQMVRVAAVVLWPRLRRASSLIVAEVFCLEVITLPFLALASYLTGDPAYSSLLIQVFVSWVAALMVVSPSVMILRYAKSMYHRAKLSTFLPASAFVFGVLVSLLGVQTTGPSSDGLRELLMSFLGTTALTSRSGGNFTSSISVAVCSVAVFFAVALYSAGVGEEKVALRSPALLLALAGMLAAMGWGAGASLLGSNAILIFTAPTAAIGGTLWWLTREKTS
jgi:hypothetical protein